MHAGGDTTQALRPMIDAVEASHDGQQHLRRADIRGRLFAADVLLAGLQRHAQGAVALGIDRNADDAARHLALELVARGHERRMRPAVAHGHPEALAVADDDVGTPFPRGGEQRQREQVSDDRQPRTHRMKLVGKGAVVFESPVGSRIRHQGAKAVAVRLKRTPVANHDVDIERLGPRGNDRDRLRMALVADEETVTFLARVPRQHAHGLGRSRTLVEQRGVGDLHAREIDHHRLIVQQRLEAPLSNLGLVRRVLRVPARIFEHVTLNDPRHERAVVPHADVRPQHPIPRSDGLQALEQVMLGQRFGKIERAIDENVARHRLLDQLLQRRDADR